MKFEVHTISFFTNLYCAGLIELINSRFYFFYFESCIRVFSTIFDFAYGAKITYKS